MQSQQQPLKRPQGVSDWTEIEEGLARVDLCNERIETMFSSVNLVLADMLQSNKWLHVGPLRS